MFYLGKVKLQIAKKKSVCWISRKGIEKVFLKILLFSVTLCCAPFLLADSLKKYSSVEDLIKEQETIRIIIDDAGGYGDITASMNVMHTLRQDMHFTGTFEILYPALSLKSMSTLFALSDSIPSDYEDVVNKRRFITLEEFNQHPELNKIVFLGMDGSPVSETDNIAARYKTKVFINIDNEIGRPSYAVISFLDDHRIYKFDNSKSYLPSPAEDITAVQQELKQNPALFANKPALNSFIENMKNKKFDVLPAYGYTLKLVLNSVGGFYYKENMLEIITGARYAQQNAPLPWRNRPLVIAVFFNYEAEASELNELIHSDVWDSLPWEKYEEAGLHSMHNTIKQLGLDQPGIFSVASISDNKTVDILNTLQPGQILLLSMGSYPKSIFEGLYTYTDTNIYPPIREGESSFSSLILTGHPHFRCGEVNINNGLAWEIGLDSITDPILKSELTNFYSEQNGFCKGAWLNNSNLYQTFGKLIIEAHDPNSSFSLYFKNLKNAAEKIENNRVYVALQELITLL